MKGKTVVNTALLNVDYMLDGVLEKNICLGVHPKVQHLVELYAIYRGTYSILKDKDEN